MNRAPYVDIHATGRCARALHSRAGFLATLRLFCFTMLSISVSQGQLYLLASPIQVPLRNDDGAVNRFTGFEQATAGDVKSVASDVGTWKAISGPLRIDTKLALNSKQCLHLAGPKSVVELDVAGGIAPGDELTFAAERWTAQGPFTFRIEKLAGTEWSEVFNGDKQVRVGRSFLSQVKVPLGDSHASRLRFTVTSPPSTGLLIDDVRIAAAKAQEIVDVQTLPVTYPVLLGNDACPFVKLRIETSGSLQPIHLKTIDLKLEGTSDIRDIASVQAISTGPSGALTYHDSIVATSPINTAQESISFSFQPGTFTLSEGMNQVWITCKLRPDANIDHRIGGTCEQVTFSNGKRVHLSSEPTVQRMGVALRNGGDDGVNTYRIPGLATTNQGSLIAVYDVRYRNGGDLPGDIDVGMSRSIDGGRTWSPMQIVMDMGKDPVHRYDGVGDPAVLVDRVNGTIWVAGLWSHGNRGWHGSGPGLTPEETGQLLLVRSDDDGLTWSEPINITSQVKLPSWCLLLQGPGKGITMQNGTLVFAAQYQDTLDNKRLPYSTIIYSTDRGKTWQIGSGAFGDTTEAQVIESEPGVLMLNCRYNRASTRVVMTTSDLGRSWQKHSTSESALIEPRACMASLIDVGRETNRQSPWLLFSNPCSTTQRHRITIQASPDRGQTWPAEHQLLLDEGIGGGYSCMTMIDEKTIGILYEGSQAHLSFQRVLLDDLTNPRPK